MKDLEKYGTHKDKKEEHKPLLGGINFFKEVILFLYPEGYARFSQKSYQEGLKYFMNVLMLSGLILICIFIFNIDAYNSSLNTEIDKFEQLNIVGEMNLKEPIVIDGGKIIIANQMNYTDENLLITQDSVTRRPLSCILFSPACWFSDKKVSKDIKEYSDITSYKEDLKLVVKVAALLMVPGLLLLYLIYIGVKTFIVIAVISLITAILIKTITTYQITLRQVFLVSIYASTAIIICEPFNLIVHSLYYLHILAFLILFVIGVNLVGERKKHI